MVACQTAERAVGDNVGLLRQFVHHVGVCPVHVRHVQNPLKRKVCLLFAREDALFRQACRQQGHGAVAYLAMLRKVPRKAGCLNEKKDAGCQ